MTQELEDIAALIDPDRPPFLWDEKMMALAEKVGDIVRSQEGEVKTKST